MIKSVDPFLDRVPSRYYNCLDFAREVWLAMTGEDITERMTRLIGDFSQRRATHSGMKGFTRLDGPVDPCFVVMQCRGVDPHIGIFHKNRILHLAQRGAEFQPLQVVKLMFRSVK